MNDQNCLAIAFDFDGVIALSEPVHQRAWIDLEREVGVSLPLGFLENGIGNTDRELSHVLAKHWQSHGIQGLTGDEILKHKRQFYQGRCGDECLLVPGAREFIEKAARSGRVALATSSSIKDVEPVLDRHGLTAFFSTVLTIESVQFPKPHPQIYLMAADEMRVSPEEMWIFEDSRTGVRAALASGARVVGVMTTYCKEDLPGPSHHVLHFEDQEGLPHELRSGP